MRAPAQGIEAEGRDRQGSVHESPTRRDAPPSPPSPPEGLPEEIVKAIEALEIAAHVLNGSFVSMQDADEADHAACKARSTLDTTILYHLSAARAERDQAQKSFNACIADMERGGTCKRVYSDVALGHALEEVEAALAAARARAERAEKALRQAAEDLANITNSADPFDDAVGTEDHKALVKVEGMAGKACDAAFAALSSVAEEA